MIIRKLDQEFSKAAHLCFKTDLPPVIMNDYVVTYRQTQSRALSGRFGCKERGKHLIPDRLRYTVAIVPDPDFHLVPLSLGADVYFWGEIRAISELLPVSLV